MKLVSLTGEKAKPENSIILCGIGYDIGKKCIKWGEANGYDGYTTKRVEVKKVDNKTGKVKRKVIKGRRFGRRSLQKITQLCVHHSGADRADPGVMYNVLYFQRGLSVHFAAEDDGRIWQFNDLIDKCWHAGSHNKISIGTECCLFPLADKRPRYYDDDRRGRTGNLPHEVIEEIIHGKKYKTFAMPRVQWETLAIVYAGVWVALGHQRKRQFNGPFSVPPVFPRDGNDNIKKSVLNNPKDHVGLIGHLHMTKRKIDPCGFPWEEFEASVEENYDRFRAGLREE